MKKVLLYSIALFLCSFFVPDLFAQSFETGKIGMSITNAGRIRVTVPVAGSYVRQVDRLSDLVAATNKAVFSYNYDADMSDSARLVTSPLKSDFEITEANDNRYSFKPPFVNVLENIYGWKDQPFAIVKYTVINKDTAAGTINPYIGFEMLAKIDNAWGFEYVRYIESKQIVSFFKDSTNLVMGLKFLSSPLISFKSFEWFDGYDTNTAKNSFFYSMMSSKTFDKSYDAQGDGSVCVFAQDVKQIPLGKSAELYFAISYGANYTEMYNNINLAVTKYQKTFTSVKLEKPGKPENYNLSQNYPNPFNPSTNIKFNIPSISRAQLKVFNSLGQEIETLVDSDLQPGSYSVEFNSYSKPSGVYYYTLRAGNFFESKKMLIFK
jgi:hypothetical protein